MKCGKGANGAEGNGPAHAARYAGAMKRFLNDFSLSAAVAGFVAVLVGFTSSVAIVFQAAQALGANTAQTSSWMWALGLGMGVTSLGLSLWTRQPVLTAWSTPGAALLAATAGISMPEAIGAFLVCGGLILLFLLLPSWDYYKSGPRV